MADEADGGAVGPRESLGAKMCEDCISSARGVGQLGQNACERARFGIEEFERIFLLVIRCPHLPPKSASNRRNPRVCRAAWSIPQAGLVKYIDFSPRFKMGKPGFNTHDDGEVCIEILNKYTKILGPRSYTITHRIASG
jgi:hypothetical protein